MYLIRPATATDQAPVTSMIHACAEWMRAHGHGRWSSWQTNAEQLGAQTADPDWPVWVLTTGSGRIVGCTTITAGTPRLGWTDQEQTKPAVFLRSTVTHPDLAGDGLGALIAFWALDHAAHQGAQWVRRGVLTIGPDNRGLIGYYRLQGWTVTRAIPHPRKATVTVWSLQRPATPQPDLDSILVEVADAVLAERH